MVVSAVHTLGHEEGCREEQHFQVEDWLSGFSLLTCCKCLSQKH